MNKEPMKIVLIEDNEYEVKQFLQYCASTTDVELLGHTGSKTIGLELVKSHAPDAVVLDIQLEEGNGLDFVYELHDLALLHSPFIIVTTNITNESTLQNLRDHGAGYVQLKTQPGYFEHGPEMVIGFLRKMRPYFVGVPRPTAAMEEPEMKERMRDQLINELGKIGIAIGTKSQNYLVEAILLQTDQEDDFVDMDNVIYPELCKMMHTTKAALERSMRCRIEATWRIVDIDTLRQNYRQYVDPIKGKPLLREFIGYYAKLIKPSKKETT